MEKVTLKEVKEFSKEKLLGRVICFPTDTVYGVGAMIDDEEAIDKIYKMKKRSDDKPLPILCSSIEQIYDYIEEVTNDSKKLMSKYWPGSLTIIYQKSNKLNPKITKGKNTVAFRMPNSEIALQIIDHFGLLATTSVNFSGCKELNSVDEIEKAFDQYIDYIVTDEASLDNVPSTIVDVTNESIKIIRQGKTFIKNE